MRAVIFSGIVCLLICVSHVNAQVSFLGTQGTFTIDTDALTMTGPDGFLFNGTDDDGVASYVFDDFRLFPSANIVTTGSRPTALISRTDLQVSGTITAGSGNDVFGQAPDVVGSGGGGGGYGGVGGNGHDNGGSGGGVYGDLTSVLLGGSAGGGTSGFFGSSSGGFGGGAIRLQAAGEVEIFGSVNANGGNGGSNGYGGGGGSGGAIIISAQEVILGDLLSANGGRGGVGEFDNGGGGGGGRILIETLQDGFNNFGTISVAPGRGGNSFFGSGSTGEEGDVSIRTFAAPAPTMVKGDVNLDGTPDFDDIEAFIVVLQAGGFQAEADCDCNEVVDFADIPAFIAILAQQ